MCSLNIFDLVVSMKISVFRSLELQKGVKNVFLYVGCVCYVDPGLAKYKTATGPI